MWNPQPIGGRIGDNMEPERLLLGGERLRFLPTREANQGRACCSREMPLPAVQPRGLDECPCVASQLAAPLVRHPLCDRLAPGVKSEQSSLALFPRVACDVFPPALCRGRLRPQ